MRRGWQSNRLTFLIIILFICGILISLSAFGIIAPLENILATPLNLLSRITTSVSLSTSDAALSFSDIEALRERNAELEVQLAELTGEVVQLREIASDYERLSDLLEYTSSTINQEFVTADVIGQGQIGFVRSIIINKGTRDGIAIGMPVMTELGLVGRIWRITANSSQVQLVTDQNSFVSGRLQTSRAEGTIGGQGLEAGQLEMLFIPLDSDIPVGDIVVTSGLGGNFPPDMVIGQVISVRNLEFELTQEAQVASLVDFSKLEFVLVVTSFEPADISAFDAEEEQ
ncbi:MAG: rod shape-determining protein MreC [Anaerolineae bacterium]|nr:rod shape-determining protein MreC [Anaerolineae bacterium]MDQ7036344.1 rod shape-determining protein MreC [Anaerolineae bacterium]